jgi:hypothetical protein
VSRVWHVHARARAPSALPGDNVVPHVCGLGAGTFVCLACFVCARGCVRDCWSATASERAMWGPSTEESGFTRGARHAREPGCACGKASARVSAACAGILRVWWVGGREGGGGAFCLTGIVDPPPPPPPGLCGASPQPWPTSTQPGVLGRLRLGCHPCGYPAGGRGCSTRCAHGRLFTLTPALPRRSRDNGS